MHCELCLKDPITSHHKCSRCGTWVGRCCLAATEPNLCRGCKGLGLNPTGNPTALETHYDNAGLGY